MVHDAHHPVITPAEGADDLAEVRALFEEYQRAAGAPVCFPGFREELAGLPGRYAPPEGRLLLARVGGAVAGVVGMCSSGAGVAEMKRLYVRPDFRGHGLGRRLAQRVLEEARAAGCRTIRLETVESMAAAHALYASMGFARVASDGDVMVFERPC